MNQEQCSNDWWLWRLYREVAEYVNQPSVSGEQEIRALLAEYREFREQKDLGLLQERGRVVDFG